MCPIVPNGDKLFSMNFALRDVTPRSTQTSDEFRNDRRLCALSYATIPQFIDDNPPSYYTSI